MTDDRDVTQETEVVTPVTPPAQTEPEPDLLIELVSTIRKAHRQADQLIPADERDARRRAATAARQEAWRERQAAAAAVAEDLKAKEIEALKAQVAELLAKLGQSAAVKPPEMPAKPPQIAPEALKPIPEPIPAVKPAERVLEAPAGLLVRLWLAISRFFK